jgi:hypothetical protein
MDAYLLQASFCFSSNRNHLSYNLVNGGTWTPVNFSGLVDKQ